MKRNQWMAAPAVLLLLAVWTGGAKSAESEIKVASLKGSASLERGTETKPLAKNDVLKAGDVVKTGSDGEAALAWADGHVAKVFPLSRFKVESAEQSGKTETQAVSVESGRIFAKIKKLQTTDSTFTIRTPTATAGARGSEIFVAHAEGASNFSVLSGEFSVTAPGIDALVGQNFELNVKAGEAPQTAAAIPPQRLQGLKVEVQQIRAEVGAAVFDRASETEKPAEETAKTAETEQDNVQDVLTNDTVVNPATETLDQLEAGTGGVYLTIE